MSPEENSLFLVEESENRIAYDYKSLNIHSFCFGIINFIAREDISTRLEDSKVVGQDGQKYLRHNIHQICEYH